jgi:hypothetical protein
MRLASVPGYYPSFPVRYSNMYNDYSMTTAGLADPFLPQKKEESNKCNFVVSYIGRNEPKFEMNNPHYMREVSRSYSDKIPPVILNKEPIQNKQPGFFPGQTIEIENPSNYSVRAGYKGKNFGVNVNVGTQGYGGGMNFNRQF